MSKRGGARTLAAAVAAVVTAGVISTVGLVSPAGATGPASGSIVPGATVPQSGYTANTPFSSGQNIDVVIPANTVLTQNENLQIVECSAPDGVLPTDDTTCDGETIQGASIKPETNGSVDLHAQTHSYYTIYALPDEASLGESASPAQCDLNDECVLYIGDDYTNFTAPHYFSPLFYVNPNGGVDSGVNPGDGSAASSSLSLVKSTTTTSYSAADQVIPYNYLVDNTGNNAVTGLTVTDNKIPTVNCPSSSLAAGADETCTGSYTTTTADVTAGSVTNIATASATDSGGNPVSSPSSQATVNYSPASGSIISGAAATSGSFTAGTPFSSGQQINVVVPANTVLPPNTNVNILECSAPNGVIPTDPSECDGETIQGASIHPEPNGAVNLQSQTGTLLTLYALPDFHSLEETTGPACSLNTECILYIGDNQNDFTQPHFWSQPFYVDPGNGLDTGANPGDGSPPVLSLTKSTTSLGYGQAGQTIEYSYLVMNNYSTSVSGVSVTDDEVAAVNCPSGSLGAGDSETCTGSYTVTSSDVTNGSVTNIATAHATGPPLDSPTSTVTVKAVPVPTVTGVSPSSGPLGGATSVTITGTGFSGVSAVTFGGSAATSFTVNSMSSITATAPGGTGTVDVQVTGTGGTSLTNPPDDQFTYVPAPTVSGISPTSGPLGGGTSVTITGTGFTGASAVKFGTAAATSFTVNSSTQITAVTPAGTGDRRHHGHHRRAAPRPPRAPTSSPTCRTPTVGSVSPTSGPTSGATSVTITGTGFTGATAVKFGTTAATQFHRQLADPDHGHHPGRGCRHRRHHGHHGRWHLGHLGRRPVHLHRRRRRSAASARPRDPLAGAPRSPSPAPASPGPAP